MNIIEKYRKILEKPMAEPFRGYIEELLLELSKSYVDTVKAGVNNDDIGKFIKDQNASKQYVLPKRSRGPVIPDSEQPDENNP